MSQTVITPQSEPPPLSHRRQIILLAIAALVAALALIIGPKVTSAFVATAPVVAPRVDPTSFQATPQEWASFRFAAVARQLFEAGIDTDGKIASDDNRTTQVFSPFTGAVTAIYAKVGDTVRTGTPLFAIRAAEFVQGEADIATNAGAVAASRALLTQTAAAEARQHDLYLHEGAALKDWQQSQVDLANAQSGLRAVLAAGAAARDRLRILGKSDAEIAALAAGRGGDKRGKAVVRSPINGVVTVRAIGVGQNVGSLTNGGAGNAAFTVSDLSRVWLVGNLREADASKAHVGQRAEVRLLAVPGVVLGGHVDFVAPSVDPVTRRVIVRASVPNPQGILKPEMFASFTLVTGRDADLLSVPDSAVIYEGETARVWVARPADRRITLRQVKVGATHDGIVGIVAGLAAGERVVTSGALFIDRAAKAES